MKISKVLYINLDHRQDRLVSIQQVLSHCPYPIQRIEGVKLGDKDLIVYQTIDDHKKFSKGGMIGCVLSHKKCVEYLLSQDLPQDEYSLILEDDVQIHKSFWELLDTINIAEDADLIFFDAISNASYAGLHDIYHNAYPIVYKIPIGINCKSQNHIQLHGEQIGNCFFGTHCLAYKNSKLKTMLKWFNKIEIYGNIDKLLVPAKQFNRYFVQTNLMFQDKINLNSDINKRLNRNIQ